MGHRLDALVKLRIVYVALYQSSKCMFGAIVTLRYCLYAPVHVGDGENRGLTTLAAQHNVFSRSTHCTRQLLCSNFPPRSIR